MGDKERDEIIMNVIKELFMKLKCINCTFSCRENTYVDGQEYYFYLSCCPKKYPLTIWLRQNAGWRTKLIKKNGYYRK